MNSQSESENARNLRSLTREAILFPQLRTLQRSGCCQTSTSSNQFKSGSIVSYVEDEANIRQFIPAVSIRRDSVAKIPGCAASAFTYADSLSSSSSREDLNQSTPSEKKGNGTVLERDMVMEARQFAAEMDANNGKPLRSYCTFENLIFKVLNQVLISLSSSANFGGEDIVRVGSRPGFMAAVIYIRGSGKSWTRTIGVVLDWKRKTTAVGETVCVRFSKIHDSSETIVTGCSCSDDTIENSCEHRIFILNSEKICRVLFSILGIELRQVCDLPLQGVLSVPRVGAERFAYWIFFTRRIYSRYMSPIVLAVEKVPPRNRSNRSIPLALRVRCLKCRRAAERRGHCEHEKKIIECKKMNEIKVQLLKTKIISLLFLERIQL